MTKTLKNLIECYQKGELSTPNIQVIDKIFSDEMINLPDDVLLDLTFSRAFFEKSRFTKIRFCNGSFGSSFFKDCFLENCVFSNINFQEMECLKCFFKDCLFMDCIFVDSDISETIFESCTISKGSLDDSEFQRSECRAVTNSGKKEALVRMLELTTSANPDFITRRLPMLSYPSQDALAYIDTNTNACLFFHADNGKLWSAKKLSQLEMIVILNNPNFENLN